MISIKPKWCDLIASGKKTIEVRKTRPKCDTPFKCYIYCTKAKQILRFVEHPNTPSEKPIFCKTKDGSSALCEERYGNGKVIGEFVCDGIKSFGVPYPAFQNEFDRAIIQESCLTYRELHRYAYHDTIYAWHISDLVIYDKPKDLSEYKKANRKCYYTDLGLASPNCIECKSDLCMVRRPPESWMYVEEANR